jgi:protein-tyrosine-phosphatase
MFRATSRILFVALVNPVRSQTAAKPVFSRLLRRFGPRTKLDDSSEASEKSGVSAKHPGVN